MPYYRLERLEYVMSRTTLKARDLKAALKKVAHSDPDDFVENDSGDLGTVLSDDRGTIVDQHIVWPNSFTAITTSVPTYHESYFDTVPKHLRDGAPNIQVTIKQNAGLDVILGDVDDVDSRCVMIERQTDRWLINISRHQGGDNDVLVYLMDDNTVVVVPDGPERGDIEFAKQVPSSLPIKHLKYPIAPSPITSEE